MMGKQALFDHLKSGATTTCRCWAVTRQDGTCLGFTDHDRELSFDGILFRADSGMTARTLHQSTGLSVDNSEALGVLSHTSVREVDIMAGRYDRAEVTCWLVNWTNPEERFLQFRGTIGEITHNSSGFQAELRGLAESLNQPQGRVFHQDCSAILGDAACAVDLSQPGYWAEWTVDSVSQNRVFRFLEGAGYEPEWFRKGQLLVLDGPAAGLSGPIQQDQQEEGQRVVSLWDRLGEKVSAGDRVRLTAGCDRRANTCRTKFNNFLNFRGFPHIPGEDWLMAYPKSGSSNDGGSLN